MSKPNGILAMNPEKYREIDGVVFDLDSYARHFKPTEQEKKCEDTPKADENPAETPSAAPAPVFAADPYPDGWYPAEDGRPCPSWAALCRRARPKMTLFARKTA